jgi:corrinoid protein of di/trimethylamine methyltransferase
MTAGLEQFYTEIADAIVNLEEDKAIECANQAVEKNYALLAVIEQGYAVGIRRVGELYDEGEYYLPELMMAAKIMQDSLAVITPHLEKDGQRKTLGTVVIATIEGDLHSIGKDIVGIMLGANGFKVYDLGADVKLDAIIAEAEAKNATIIGLSALLTTTMAGQKIIVEKLIEQGIRKKYKVILGGAPVTEKWTTECGADGYAGSAIEAVELLKKWVSE